MSKKNAVIFSCWLMVFLVFPNLSVGQSNEREIGLAVMPLPEGDREGATVMGYAGGDELHVIREGTGDFICLADAPGDERYKAACYHKSLEPYMARGRELRTEGITGKTGIEIRWAEIEAGTLFMPTNPAAIHQLFGADPEGMTVGDMEGLGRLTAIYMSMVTAEEAGLPIAPSGNIPWIMFPGTPTSHVMISH